MVAPGDTHARQTPASAGPDDPAIESAIAHCTSVGSGGDPASVSPAHARGPALSRQRRDGANAGSGDRRAPEVWHEPTCECLWRGLQARPRGASRVRGRARRCCTVSWCGFATGGRIDLRHHLLVESSGPVLRRTPSGGRRDRPLHSRASQQHFALARTRTAPESEHPRPADDARRKTSISHSCQNSSLRGAGSLR